MGNPPIIFSKKKKKKIKTKIENGNGNGNGKGKSIPFKNNYFSCTISHITIQIRMTLSAYTVISLYYYF